MAGRHGMRDGQPPATTTTTKLKFRSSVSASPYPTTLLSNHDNNQLRGEGFPMYPGKYFFFFYYS
jgi:hypothetical protein